MTDVGKIVRALVGIAVIGILLVTVNGWYGDYKKASHAKKSTTTVATATVEATAVVAVAGGKKVAVLVDGEVLRVTPSAGGAAVRTLKKGEQLILVGTVGSWLQLRDATNGKMGYVVNDTAKVKVQK